MKLTYSKKVHAINLLGQGRCEEDGVSHVMNRALRARSVVVIPRWRQDVAIGMKPHEELKPLCDMQQQQESHT